jgi:hypothetical protein
MFIGIAILSFSYPSGAPEFTTGFNEVRVTGSLVLCVNAL